GVWNVPGEVPDHETLYIPGKSISPSGAIILINGIEKIVIIIAVKTITVANFTVFFLSGIRIFNHFFFLYIN
ncbi:MAG: hypothetical protein ACFFE5_09365, partial [Candidatus Thorarchaeota archaeon]